MIENVRSAMARMAAIRSTMTGAQSAPLSPSESGTSPESIQALFSQVLSQAGGFARAGALPYGLGNIGGLTPVAGLVQTGAPPGLEGFVNGRVPLNFLVPVDLTGERMLPGAASAFTHMRGDAARAGVALPIVDAYRSYEDQIAVADALGLYREGGKAAVPGTSQHGWGRALDLELTDAGLTWMRNNAWKYGFVETVPREPWHWEFHPA